jgi:hypothetical protein
MNTVGKTLVILNFLFAVIVGGFLVVDFATRSDWKAAYKSLNDQVTVLKADRDTAVDSMNPLINKNKELETKLENLKKDMDDQAVKAKADQLKFEGQLLDTKIELDDARLSLTKARTDVERLKVAEADLRGIVKEREAKILSQQDIIAKLGVAAIASEQKAVTAAERNQELLKQVQDLTAQMNQIKLAGATGQVPGITVKTGTTLNPPPTLVKGKIERVDPADKTLVEISLGTDQGVNKNNTLEVFRTSPEPKYLGVVRIVDANFNKSVGRLIVAPGTTVRPQLQVGDSAWSYLTRD